MPRAYLRNMVSDQPVAVTLIKTATSEITIGEAPNIVETDKKVAICLGNPPEQEMQYGLGANGWDYEPAHVNMLIDYNGEEIITFNKVYTEDINFNVFAAELADFINNSLGISLVGKSEDIIPNKFYPDVVETNSAISGRRFVFGTEFENALNLYGVLPSQTDVPDLTFLRFIPNPNAPPNTKTMMQLICKSLGVEGIQAWVGFDNELILHSAGPHR